MSEHALSRLGSNDASTVVGGSTFSAVDVLWGTALNWMTQFKLVPELPVIRRYIDRVM